MSVLLEFQLFTLSSLWMGVCPFLLLWLSLSLILIYYRVFTSVSFVQTALPNSITSVSFIFFDFLLSIIEGGFLLGFVFIINTSNLKLLLLLLLRQNDFPIITMILFLLSLVLLRRENDLYA